MVQGRRAGTSTLTGMRKLTGPACLKDRPNSIKTEVECIVTVRTWHVSMSTSAVEPGMYVKIGKTNIGGIRQSSSRNLQLFC